MNKEPDYYSPEFQKNARLGEYWYDQIWKNVKKCPFCDLKEKYVITKVGGMFLTTNLFPYVDYHLLIVPQKHVISLDELRQEDWQNVFSLLKVAGKLLKKVAEVDAYNILLREGSHEKKTIKHLHFHIIPFRSDLENWNYQKINKVPIEAAEELREALNERNK